MKHGIFAITNIDSEGMRKDVYTCDIYNETKSGKEFCYVKKQCDVFTNNGEEFIHSADYSWIENDYRLYIANNVNDVPALILSGTVEWVSALTEITV